MFAGMMRIVLLLCVLTSGAYGARMRLELTEGISEGPYLGYLVRVGNDLKFQWSNEPVPDAIASLTPGEGIIEKYVRWKTIGQAIPIKRPVTNTHDFCVGLTSFFRHARKNGVMVTMLRDEATIAVWNGGAAELIGVGQPFDISQVQVIGAAEAGTTKLDDLSTMSGLQQGMFTGAIRKIGGAFVSLVGDPVLKPATNSADGALPAVTPQVEISTGDTLTVTDNSPTDNSPTEGSEEGSPGKGCYLLLRRYSAGNAEGYRLGYKYSVSKPENAVAFFKPSEAKVPGNSWKYGRPEQKYMDQTMTSATAHRQIEKYYQKWVSFLNMAQKMDGVFQMLPMPDGYEAFATRVMFMKPGMEIIVAEPGEPVELGDKSIAAVINAQNSQKMALFDRPGAIAPVIFRQEVLDGGDGFLATWAD